MKYDHVFDYQINNKKVNIGVLNGNNTIVLVIPGQNTDIYGYEERYLKLSTKMNKDYGVSVIISSNPFKMDDPIEELMFFINKYAEKFDDYKLYYFGFSKGANIGAQFATLEDKFKRLVLVNGPLMINYHKTKDGINRFNGEKMTFVYGELDPSFKYSELITLEPKDNIKLLTLKNMDHNVKNEMVFLDIPAKTLFYDF